MYKRQLIQGVFFFVSFFLRQLLYEHFEDISSWVRYGVDRMAHSIDQPLLVKCLFLQQVVQILAHFIFVFPVRKIFLHVFKHLSYLDVRTAVLWPLKGRHGRGDGGICSGAG